MLAIVDEVLEAEELDSTHLPVVVPVDGELELAGLQGTTYKSNRIWTIHVHVEYCIAERGATDVRRTE